MTAHFQFFMILGAAILLLIIFALLKKGQNTLAIMNVTAVVSLRGLPAEAVYGMSSAFYYLFAAIVFLIRCV